jgi:uncharacterized protein with WD repeat
MEVSITLQCPCRPGFVYKNEASMKMHQKTKLHKTWETSQEVKDVRVQWKFFENEIERLKRRLAHKEEVEVVLLNKIQMLETQIGQLHKQLEGVYVY